MKHYQYRKSGWRRPEADRRPPSSTSETEGFTGFVKGKKASDLEERYARALDSNPRVTGYRFNELINTPFQIPGQLNQIDFIVYSGPFVQPVEIDGEFSHKTQEDKAHDLIRDQQLMPYIKAIWPGAREIVRIPDTKLLTQDQADTLVRRMF